MMGHAPQAGASATAAARVLTINSQATLPQMNPGGGTREPAETRTMAEGGGDPHQHGGATQCRTTVAIASFADCPHIGNVARKSSCNKCGRPRREGAAW
jgi:hypothetical protein